MLRSVLWNDPFDDQDLASMFAQEYMRQELEQKKLEKKRKTSAEKQARKDEQFSLKQQKKKAKHRGH